MTYGQFRGGIHRPRPLDRDENIAAGRKISHALSLPRVLSGGSFVLGSLTCLRKWNRSCSLSVIPPRTTSPGDEQRIARKGRSNDSGALEKTRASAPCANQRAGESDGARPFRGRRRDSKKISRFFSRRGIFRAKSTFATCEIVSGRSCRVPFPGVRWTGRSAPR